MRILIATWSARRVGGTENYLHALLPALRQAGHEVALFVERDVPAHREPIVDDPAVPVHAGAPDAARGWRPDVVYAHGLEDPAREADLLRAAPAVLFVHSYYGMCISGTKTLQWPTVRPCAHALTPLCLLRYYPRRIGGRSPVTMLRRYREQRRRLALMRDYRALVTHTDHMRRELLRHGHDPARTAAIPFLVPPPPAGDVFPPPAAPPWRLLFAGRMDRLKGGDYLLDALPRVRDGCGPVHVTMAGDGPERGAWRERAAALEAAHADITIDFPGWLAAAAMARAWRDAHLLVVPSLWPEPFGSVGPEAGHRGRPAAAFDVGGITDWLTDGRTGHLAPGNPPTRAGLADAIVRCLADPARYASLAAGARAMAGRYSAPAHLNALLPILEAAAGRA